MSGDIKYYVKTFKDLKTAIKNGKDEIKKLEKRLSEIKPIIYKKIIDMDAKEYDGIKISQVRPVEKKPREKKEEKIERLTNQVKQLVGAHIDENLIEEIISISLSKKKINPEEGTRLGAT